MFQSETYRAPNIVCGGPRARHNRDSFTHGLGMEPDRLAAVLQDPALLPEKDLDSRDRKDEEWKGRACEHQGRQETY